MNEERNEKLNEVDEVLEDKEMTDDEAKEISGGFGITPWGVLNATEKTQAKLKKK